jgi:cobalt-zinc-cadmium efflux system membrane fusion protein
MKNKQLATGFWPLAKNNNKGYFKIISIVNFLKTKIEPHRNIENIALNYVIYVSMWLFNSIKNNILYCNNIGSCKVILQLQKSNSETSISLHFANIYSKIKTILLLIILTTFIACGNSKPAEKEVEATLETVVNLTNDQIKNANIGLGKLEQKTVSSILKVNGKIDVPPQNMVSVSVPLGGYLKSTKLLPGMHVSKGEVIAVMEDQQYIQLQQDYLLAKTKLGFMLNEYNRQKELNLSKASSDKVFQQTESEFISQKITLKSLAEKLKLIGLNPETVNENTISKSINIYSPINGYVTMVNVNIGKYSQPSEVLFELVNPIDIHLALTVFEKDLTQIEIGQKLVAYTNNKPNEKHPCEIILVGHSVSKDRITEVHCHFLDYDRTLLPGMYMNAEIELKKNDAFVLPEEAIVRFENIQYVFIEKDKNNFEMVPVTTGSVEKGFIEILDAEKLLAKNIVTKGAYSILMKTKNKSEE